MIVTMRARYFFILSFIVCVCGSYLIGNEFIKQSPIKERKKKAQRQSLAEQCGYALDALLIKSFDMPHIIGRFSNTVYQTLRRAACGESCCIEKADTESLKAIIAQIESCESLMKQLDEGYQKLESLLAASN